MSVMPHSQPEYTNVARSSIEVVLQGRARELGDGFTVQRLLPSAARRMVGPFIFFDHFGPVQLSPGKGLDVRPHPHINLATVTYLFDGEILHRDSLGSEQLITPHAVNWMTAGRGIVHSERSPAAARRDGAWMHGLQLWVALPTAFEEIAPSFRHYAETEIPNVELEGARLRVVAGSAFGVTSPVETLSELFYVDAQLEAAAELCVPDAYAGRAAYVIDGSVSCEESRYGAGTMIVFREGLEARIAAVDAARVMLLGGAPVDGERHVWWNFVSSSKDRIEQARLAWKDRHFPTVPGDEHEFIPLPSEMPK